jgi:archaeal flagellin FlaB
MKKMRQIKNILKTQDLGDMGIGAMIVFIAMVLVAGIAASVLIQTANRLEIQAMTTGQETTNEVATGIAVDGVAGQKGSKNYTSAGGTNVSSKLLNVTITVGPRSGSKDVDLSKTVIEITDSTNKILMTYFSTNFFAAPAAAGVFSTAAFDGNAKQFGVIVLEDADTSLSSGSPVINRGDHVLLTLSTGLALDGLSERSDVWGMVIPEDGAPGIFAFRTPASYSDTVYELY